MPRRAISLGDQKPIEQQPCLSPLITPPKRARRSLWWSDQGTQAGLLLDRLLVAQGNRPSRHRLGSHALSHPSSGVMRVWTEQLSAGRRFALVIVAVGLG